MPVYKLTFIFNVPKNGWTETWYWTGANHDAAGNVAIAYANDRTNLLGQGATLEAIRISDEAIEGDALLITGGYTKNGTHVGAAARDAVWVGWDCRFQASPLYRRNLLLRGIPDDWVAYTQTGTEIAPNATLTQRFRILEQAVINNGLAMRVNKRDAANPKKPIFQISQSVGGSYLITGNPAELVQGDFFRIYDVQAGYVGLRGRQRVQSVVGDVGYETFTAVNGLPFYNGLATFRKEIFEYPQITFGFLLRISKRDTGRRFFVTRGRRKAST